MSGSFIKQWPSTGGEFKRPCLTSEVQWGFHSDSNLGFHSGIPFGWRSTFLWLVGLWTKQWSPSDKFVWTWEHAKAVARSAAVKFLWMQDGNPWDGLNSLLYVLKCLAEFKKVSSQLCGDQLLLSGCRVEPPLWTAGWHQGFQLGCCLFPEQRERFPTRGGPNGTHSRSGDPRNRHRHTSRRS